MAKSFDTLKNGMTPKARNAAEAKAEAMIKAMPLAELRQARKLSQEQLARTLCIKQAAVSKMERRTDMYISTLRDFIQAMGGELEITARFPEGSIKIDQFTGLDESLPVSR